MASAYSTLDENEKKGVGRFLNATFWRNLAYAGVGIVIVSIIAAIVLILVLTYKKPVNKAPYSFEHMFDPALTPESFYPVWSTSPKSNQILYWKTISKNDALQSSSQQSQQATSSRHYTMNQPKSIDQMLRENDMEALKRQTMMYSSSSSSSSVSSSNETCVIMSKDPSTGKENIIFDQSKFSETISCGTTFTVSPDARYISFKTQVEKVFRHSIIGKYLFFDVQTQKFSDVSPHGDKKQKTLVWCPNGNSVAFVENNNLYVRKSPEAQAVQVTTDGDDEMLFNGVTDWIYEEEVFGSVEAFVWNQDCSKIAFLKLDESKVPVYRYEEYFADNPYPVPINIRIPNPGYPNPVPSVHIYDLDDDRVLDVDLGPVDTGDLTKDFYVYDLKFANVTSLAIITVPRVQQKKNILLVNTQVEQKVTEPVIVRTETTNTWIQYARQVNFLSGTQYVDLVAHENYYHIALFDIGQPNPIKFLTSGPYEVTDILAYNSESNELFYVSTEKGSTERHIYAVNVVKGDKRSLSGEQEGFFTASFSSDANFYVLSYQGPNLPRTVLKSVDEAKNITEVLVDNSHMKERFDALNMPQPRITTMKNAYGQEMNVLYMFPPEWTEGTEVQFPVLMYMYNGPGSQLVTKSFSGMHNAFSMYMASQGFIVATVDARGTGFKGIEYMTCTYKNLGEKEVEDQIYAAKVIGARADTDRSRISIWGWSYGGYMASKAISSTLNQGVFRLGLSVAPVTDWAYYDSAYTERYMQWPAINKFGYENSSVITQVRHPQCPMLPTEHKDKKTGEVSLEQSNTRFVLVHGTGDDNVHPLNAFNLMTELQNSRVQFESMFYANKDHSISGPNTRRHLYTFLSNKLKQYIFNDEQL